MRCTDPAGEPAGDEQYDKAYFDSDDEDDSKRKVSHSDCSLAAVLLT